MNRPIVLILGAAGRLGKSATNAFAAAGWRVLAQVRRPVELPDGAEGVHAPLSDTTALVERAAGAAIVVYAVNPLYDRWDAELLPMARQGMDVAEALGATLVLPGNVYNYGPEMPPRLQESTPQPGGTTKGRQRCAMEEEIRQRTTRGQMKAVIIRAGDFYGSGTGTWIDQAIAKDIEDGKLVYPGPLDLPHAWAYLPDLARAFVAVADRRIQRGGAAFEDLLFAGHTLTGRELLAVVKTAADELGLRRRSGWRIAGMPWPMIRVVGVFKPILRELARMSYLWRVPHAIDGASLERVVGPLPTTPPAQAMRLTLSELKTQN